MNISGIGFYMSPAAVNHYDRLSQGFGKYDYSNQYKPAQEQPLAQMPAAEVKLSVNRAVEQKNADSDLEEFATFVGSGAQGEPAAHYSEDWTRPIENFDLSVG